MSKIFGKKKGKQKNHDFRSYVNITQSLMPPAVFIATPRIAGCAYEPIILRPSDLSGFEHEPSCEGFATNRRRSTDISSQPDNQAVSDDERESVESVCDDYEIPSQALFVSDAVRNVVDPPEGFGDLNNDTDRSFADQSFSAHVAIASSSFHPGDLEVYAPAPGLMASGVSDLRRTNGSDGSLRHSSRSRVEDPHSLHSTFEYLKSTSDEVIESRVVPTIVTNMYRSPPKQLRNSFSDLHKSDPTLNLHVHKSDSTLNLPETRQLQASSTELLSPDELRTSGKSLKSLKSLNAKEDHLNLEQLERIRQLEYENQRLNEYIEIQKHEISDFAKKRDETETPGHIVSQRKSREEVETLKNLVHRLNTELDVYHKKFRKLTSSDMEDIASFPIRGPKPSWLVNTKYLAPLLVAYDDRLKDKESIIETYENKLGQFQEKVDEILSENARLHIRLEQTDAVGPISMTEWRQFQEQCKLVLEENQLLMQQLELQQDKDKEIQKTFVQETSKLTQKVNLAETEKAQVQLEVNELREKLGSLKQKYDDAVVDNRLKVNREEHIDALSVVKQTAQEETARHAKELAEMSAKIKTVEIEKEHAERELERVKLTVKELETEVKNKSKAEKKYKKEIEYLQLTVNDSEILTAKVRQYLASVLKTAEVTAKERDNLAVSVQEEEKAKMAALKKLNLESVDVEKIREKMKAYNTKKKEKLDRMASRLKEQDNVFNLQRQEYEREIKRLRHLVRDKEEMVNIIREEKQIVLEDLETMWQAASKDNQRMQDTIRQTNRKLQEHASLRTRLDDDPEPSNILDQMLKYCGCDGES